MTAIARMRIQIATAMIAGVAGLLTAGAATGLAAERSAPATAVNLAQGTVSPEGWECRWGLYIRWAGVKGVETYTLKFYDGGYQRDIEQTISAPYHDDLGGEAFKPPAGVHQLGWTGGVGWGYGAPPADFCEPGTDTHRAQNPTVHWIQPGSFIEGTVTGPCEDGAGECPLAGVKVQATAKGKKGKGRSATTDSFGSYGMKVKAGSYEVAADESGLRFDPRTKRVTVKAEQVARADFRAKETKPKPKLVGTVVQLKAIKKGSTPHAQIFRDGKWRPLERGDDVREHARVRTAGNTQMAIELDLGGRVVIRPFSEARIGERSVSNPIALERPWEIKKGSVWAQCGQMKESLEIQTTGGIMGIVDTRGGVPPPRVGEQVGTITSLAAPETLQVTPKGGVAAPAQQGQALVLGDFLNPYPGVAATLQLTRPASVGKKAPLVKIEPQGGAEPIVSIDRPDAVLNVAING